MLYNLVNKDMEMEESQEISDFYQLFFLNCPEIKVKRWFGAIKIEFQMLTCSHLKDDDPSIGNVVKVDSSFVWVAVSSMTRSVVLVPVDTQASYIDAPIGQRLRAQAQ